MHTTNVRELKKNPSRALRLAKDGPVLILKGDEPDALLIHLDKSLTETESGVRPALAASLYVSGGVSLGKALRVVLHHGRHDPPQGAVVLDPGVLLGLRNRHTSAKD